MQISLQPPAPPTKKIPSPPGQELPVSSPLLLDLCWSGWKTRTPFLPLSLKPSQNLTTLQKEEQEGDGASHRGTLPPTRSLRVKGERSVHMHRWPTRPGVWPQGWGGAGRVGVAETLLPWDIRSLSALSPACLPGWVPWGLDFVSISLSRHFKTVILIPELVMNVKYLKHNWLWEYVLLEHLVPQLFFFQILNCIFHITERKMYDTKLVLWEDTDSIWVEGPSMHIKGLVTWAEILNIPYSLRNWTKVTTDCMMFLSSKIPEIPYVF